MALLKHPARLIAPAVATQASAFDSSSLHSRHRIRSGQRRHAATQLALLPIATAVLVACGPGSPAPTLSTAPATSATSPASSPPSPTSGTGAATALDAYRGMWRAYVDASRIPDPQHADLPKYTQGDALKVFVNGLASMQRDGLVGQGDVTLHPKATTVRPNASPPTVDIEDCVDTSKTRLLKTDGSPYADTPGGRQSAKATVSRLDDGAWRVTSFALQSVGTC